MAAVHARARAHVDHVVGAADHVLVVLHHQHRVAQVAQVLQRGDEAVVVALVQADAGLVEHVHHAGQAAADLARQADALGLATAERVGAAVQAQVVQAHIVEEFQPLADLVDHARGDVALGARQLQAREIGQRFAQRDVADLVDRLFLLAFAHEHVARFLAQARAAALRAGLGGAVAGQLFAHVGAVGLAVAALEVADDAFEGVLLVDLFAGALPRFECVAELDLFFARAVEQHLLHRFGQRFPGRIGAEFVVRRQAFDHGEVVAVAPVPALDGAAGQAERGEGDHALGVEHLRVAQAVAAGAGAHGRVEREQPRLQLAHGVAADRAGELGRETVFGAAVHFDRDGAALGQAQRGLEAFGQALSLRVGALFFGRTHLDAVDHHVDVVFLGLLQRRQGVGLQHLAVDAEAHIALGLHVGEQLQELALLLARHGRHDHEARVLRQGQHRVHHLRHALRGQR
ncbi:hypothetical protein FQZ97_636620 [compost metagenome]